MVEVRVGRPNPAAELQIARARGGAAWFVMNTR
jgi:hypothetical protein